MYAFRDGILDSGSASTSIVYDKKAAYGLVLSHEDELNSPDPSRFTYRSSPHDIGRYRLTAATTASRHPIRVLRSHTLRSLWAPRAGLRYDGL